jgi:hypothetical protein
MTEAFVLGGVRTPFTRYGGSLSHIRRDDLLGLAMMGACERVGVGLDQIDEVVAGRVNPGSFTEKARAAERLSTSRCSHSPGPRPYERILPFHRHHLLKATSLRCKGKPTVPQPANSHRCGLSRLRPRCR